MNAVMALQADLTKADRFVMFTFYSLYLSAVAPPPVPQIYDAEDTEILQVRKEGAYLPRRLS